MFNAEEQAVQHLLDPQQRLGVGIRVRVSANRWDLIGGKLVGYQLRTEQSLKRKSEQHFFSPDQFWWHRD